MSEQVYRAYRCRIYPTKEQKRRIDTTINDCRYVYNHMLAQNNKRYRRRGENTLSWMDMQNLLPSMKVYLP